MLRSVQTDVVVTGSNYDYTVDSINASTCRQSSESSNLSLDFEVSSISAGSVRSLVMEVTPRGLHKEANVGHGGKNTFQLFFIVFVLIVAEFFFYLK